MKRVVVASHAQDRGIGAQMLHFCEDDARESGASELCAHARETAVPFYLKSNSRPKATTSTKRYSAYRGAKAL